jgi:hypothetical protein
MLAAYLKSQPGRRSADGQSDLLQTAGVTAHSGDFPALGVTLSIGPVRVRCAFQIARADGAGSASAEARQRPPRRRRRGSRRLRAVSAEAMTTTLMPDGGQACAQRGQLLNGENCTVVLSDVVAFGASTRNDTDRLIIREALFNMTHAALRGIPSGWSWDDRGDGLLMVVPPGVPTASVIAQLVEELPAALDRHNSTHRASTRIQLRVAVTVGPVVSDTMGVSGEAIILSARLVDAPVLKEAIAKSTASLGVIASSFVYETAIRHGQAPVDKAGYAQVQVEVKEISMPAWIKLFDAPLPPFTTQPVVITSTA